MIKTFDQFLQASAVQSRYPGKIPSVANREQQLSFLHTARMVLRAPIIPSTSLTELPREVEHEVQRFFWSLVLTQLFARIELNFVPVQIPFALDLQSGQLSPQGREKHRLIHLLALPHHSLVGLKPLVFSGIDPVAYFELYNFMSRLSHEFNPAMEDSNMYHTATQFIEMLAPFSVDMVSWFREQEQASPYGLYLDFT